MMIKIEKAIEYLFYLLVLTYFVGKVFNVFVLLIDLLFIYSVFKSDKKEVFTELFKKYKDLIFAFGIFIFYLLVQAIFLEYRSNVYVYALQTFLFVILLFAAIYTFDDREKLMKLIYVSYFILLFVAIDSYWQYFTGTDFFGKNMYGNGRRITAWHDMPKVNLMMGQFFGLLIASLFILKDNAKKVAIVMFVVILGLFVIAGNRSPILALFSSIFIIGIFSIYRKYILGILLGCFIIFGFSFLNPKLNKAYSSLFNPTSMEATSGRLAIYDAGYEMIKDNPLMGIGPKNFRHYFKKYFSKIDQSRYPIKYVENLSKKGIFHIHSVTLDMIISYGLIGFSLFLYILYQIYKNFIYNNEIGLIASIGFLYCITPMQFGRSFTQSEWQFITYLGLIFLVVISRYKQISEDKTISTRGFNGQ